MAANKVKSATERAIAYVEKTSRIKLQDLRDNPGARVAVSLLSSFYTHFKSLDSFVLG